MRYLVCICTTIWFFSSAKAQTADDLNLSKNLEPVTENNFFGSADYYNWCPSIIKGKNGLYHLFYSRWKKSQSFNAWLPLGEIAHATAKNPLGPWLYKETVFGGSGKGWDAISAFNSKIKFFKGKYYLYYVSTNAGEVKLSEADLQNIAKVGGKHKYWQLLRRNQRTGVAVSKSLNGPWQRFDKPIVEPSGPIQTLTVNPAVAEGRDKRFYMIVKGDKPGGEKYFLRNQALAIADKPEGPFIIQPKPVVDNLDTEDVSMWYDKSRNRFYAVFHSTEGFIGMMTSANGIDWEKAVDYKLTPKTLKKADGTLYKPEKMERPFVYIEKGKPTVFSVAVKDGEDSYDVFVPIK